MSSVHELPLICLHYLGGGLSDTVLTLHSDHQQYQAVSINVARHQILHQLDIVPVFSYAHIRDESRKIHQCQVGHLLTRYLEHDDIPRKGQLLRPGPGSFAFFVLDEGVGKEEGGVESRVEDGQLSLADAVFDEIRVGDGGSEVNFWDFILGTSRIQA